MKLMSFKLRDFHCLLWAAAVVGIMAAPTRGQNRFATSDNLSGYVHWIDLYDAQNNRIDPNAENPQPYSPARTCGRCHEFDTISHGWHFNAVDPDAEHGRPGQPWIWSDHRTGTHLPLSYRGWEGTHNPDDLGLSRWQVAAKLGGFLPGGGVGSKDSLAATPGPVDGEPPEGFEDRTNVTGELPVDCMLCHRNQGNGYSPFAWTEQIEVENFAYAPVVALGLATVSGNMSRLKDDFDPTDEEDREKLPKVTYETSRFRGDGKVFFDLVRKPKSDSCYYCHTNMSADSLQGERWLHDEDVHIRAGLACADCHRNSLDHHTVRGFDGESHVAGTLAASLSCQGCHMGGQDEESELARGGRFGAPKPEHKGLPPLHFEKMTCTACHAGPALSAEVPRQVNSIAHRLGEHIKRTGEELPGIRGLVNLPVNYADLKRLAKNSEAAKVEAEASGTTAAAVSNTAEAGLLGEAQTAGKYTPHRMMWPSFWGTILDGKVTVLNPEQAYEVVRKPLRVRRDFVEELSKVKLSSSAKKEILGEDRARTREDDWTDEEKEKMAAAEEVARKEQVEEKVAEALEAIEKEFEGTQAVFVSGGVGFVRATSAAENASEGASESLLQEVGANVLGDVAEPYAWPLGHNVRPARQSLGATGCYECHADSSLFFNAQLEPVGALPGQSTTAIATSELQGVDMVRLSTWSQLFAGRESFKIAGIAALGLTILVTLCALAINVGAIWRR